ncbi:hypothetical protein MHYP_G00119070 [Metynnis hypsauchen]
MSTDLDEEADNNQPLEKMENQTMSTKADVIEELMEALLQEVVAHSAALESEKLKKTAAEAENEVIQELMNICLDGTEETVEKHLGDDLLEVVATEGEAQVIKDLVLTDLQDTDTEPLVMNSADTVDEASTDSMNAHVEENDTPNDHLLDVEEKSDAEPDWMLDYEPIKSWADFMEETEGTIDQPVESLESERNELLNRINTKEKQVNPSHEEEPTPSSDSEGRSDEAGLDLL